MLLHQLFRNSPGQPWLHRDSRSRPPGRGRLRPRLEALEDRAVPSILTVTSAADDGSSGTLRSVIASASPGDTITFANSLRGDTITLTKGELNITQSLDIEGLGADQLSVSGNNSSRVFEVAAGLSVTISGLTVTDGYALDQGGGILNDGSNLILSANVVSNSVVLGSTSTAARGGGLRSASSNERSNQRVAVGN